MTHDGTELRHRRQIDQLSQRYVGTKCQDPIGAQGRITLVIDPVKVNTPRIFWAA